jgi:hypothetical protein
MILVQMEKNLAAVVNMNKNQSLFNAWYHIRFKGVHFSRQNYFYMNPRVGVPI